MARYIDADNIPYYLDTSEEAPMEGRKITFKSDIDRMPTADVAEVKHGEWIMKETLIRSPYAKNAYCSECYEETAFNYKYCPNCGAKMDGGKAE